MRFCTLSSPPIYGGNIFLYEDRDMTGCYLSNNLIIVPFHSLSDRPPTLFSEKFDIAVIGPPNGVEVKSLFPLELFHSVPNEIIFDSLQAMNGQLVLSRHQIDSSCFHQFEFQDDLVSGESGVVIKGTIYLDHKFDSTRKNEKFDCPLFMLVARLANNRRIGLAVYLPEILCNFRLAEFGRTMADVRIDMNDWELITTSGQINSLARNLDRNTLWQGLLALGNPVDVNLIKHIDSNMYNSGKFVPRYEKLYNGLCLADRTIRKDNTVTDTCWVIEYERKNHRGTNGYYAEVGKEMVAASILNLEMQVTEVKTFSGSSIPISVDKTSFDNHYNKDPTNYKCHHPFFCELNENCKGILISHCCIRPSHLVSLNKCFNDMNVKLQKQFGETNTYEYVKLSSTISW